MSLPDGLDGYGLLAMDPQFDGRCPCFTLELPEGTYEGHCWRVCSVCPGPGVHYEGDRDIARQMAALLTEIDWYGEWAVVEGLRGRHAVRQDEREPR